MSENNFEQELEEWFRASKERFANECLEDGKVWVVKFFPARHLRSFLSGGNRLMISTTSGFTWGDGVYVAPLRFACSPMIFGRTGVIGYVEWSNSIKVFDATGRIGIDLYQTWIQSVRSIYDVLTTTVHANHANRILRNLFRSFFAIDIVFFPPDQFNDSYTSLDGDYWLNVSDFSHGVLPAQIPLFSDVVKDCRWVSLTNEEFEPDSLQIEYRSNVAPNLPRNTPAAARNTAFTISRLKHFHGLNATPGLGSPHQIHFEDL